MIKWGRSYKETNLLLEKFGSPLYVYDIDIIQEKCQAFTGAGIKNYFAVKALPNPHVLKVVQQNGMGVDCSSIAELELARMSGFTGEDIIFSSNNTTMDEFDHAAKMGAMINFDDLSLVKKYLAHADRPLEVAFCRFNPGEMSFDSESQDIIGKPSNAKFGMTRNQIKQAYKLLQDSGVIRFGLHTMLLSNELDHSNHALIAQHMFELAVEINNELGIEFDFINLGGGFGAAYHEDDMDFDIVAYTKILKDKQKKSGLTTIGNPKIVTENGRWVTSDAGYLLTKVINIKDTYKKYIGVDASMANLMRPGMYGAYHYISALSPRAGFDSGKRELVDVVGSLCENNDKFAVNREMPAVQEDDILAIHNTGAHGHAMGFQYNGKLRSAEVLISSSKDPVLIRRAETLDDLFVTIEPMEEL